MRFTEKITKKLLNKNVISRDEYEIYQYGLEQLLRNALMFVLVVIVGICLGALIEMLVILVSFMCLRMYAGGYHASTSLRCLLLTIFSMTAGLSAVRFIELDSKYIILILAVLGILCVGIIPVEAPNKPLDEIELLVYKRKTIKIWIGEFLFALMCVLIGWDMISRCVLAAHMILAVSLIAGYMTKNRMEN